MAGTLPCTRMRDWSKTGPTMRAGTSGVCALETGPQKIMLSKAENASKQESRFIMTSKPLKSHKGCAVVRVCSVHEGCQRESRNLIVQKRGKSGPPQFHCSGPSVLRAKALKNHQPWSG